MSKRKLIGYLKELPRDELEEQLLDLYQKFKEVKTYYNFVFNPNEEKLIRDAKQRIKKEYFPDGRRRARKRRSIAQKLIQHFLKLGVETTLIADLMLYNLEVAQQYTEKHPIFSEAFYKSMLKSFREVNLFVREQYLSNLFEDRLSAIVDRSMAQSWFNAEGFEQSYLDFKTLHA